MPKPYYEANGVAIYNGDCRELLPLLEQVHSIITDPPYELGFMGKSWDKSGIANDPAMWAECLRVLRPGGHLLAFGGSRTYHRMACAIEDAGFEVRDQIMWLYGSGFPKSLNLGNGRGTALKPAHEPICVARRPLEGTVADNFEKHGTGTLDIDGCRVGVEGGSSEPNGGGIHRYNKMLHQQGYRPSAYQPTREGEVSAERRYTEEGGTDFAVLPGPRGGDPKGRWPANVIHDGSEEVMSRFPHTASRSDANIKTDSAAERNGNSGAAYGAESRKAGTESVVYGDEGNACRFFYAAKADKEERERNMDSALSPLAYGNQAQAEVKRGNLSHAGKSGINTVKMRGNTHPTVKPLDLMRYLCKLLCPPSGGILLDPFMGSGSTILAGRNFYQRCIGIELEEKYCEIAAKRLSKEVLQF